MSSMSLFDNNEWSTSLDQLFPFLESYADNKNRIKDISTNTKIRNNISVKM